MKRYTSIYELAAELDAKGFVRDRDINIPADCGVEGSLHCDDGSLYSYDDYKAYYIHPKDSINEDTARYAAHLTILP